MCVVASARIRSRPRRQSGAKRIGKNRLLGRIPEGAALIVPDTPKIMQLSCLSQFGYDSLHSSGNLLQRAAACAAPPLCALEPPHLIRIRQRMAAVTQNTDATHALACSHRVIHPITEFPLCGAYLSFELDKLHPHCTRKTSTRVESLKPKARTEFRERASETAISGSQATNGRTGIRGTAGSASGRRGRRERRRRRRHSQVATVMDDEERGFTSACACF